MLGSSGTELFSLVWVWVFGFTVCLLLLPRAIVIDVDVARFGRVNR